MLISVVRIKGECDTWWGNVVRLLSGRGVRRDSPEQAALAESIKALQTALTATTANTSPSPIGLLISHDGAGSDRAATVVTFANPEERATQDTNAAPKILP